MKTGMSMGIVAVYGLLRRTPKFLSPESNSKMNTPMCIKPTRAKNYVIKTMLLFTFGNNLH